MGEILKFLITIILQLGGLTGVYIPSSDDYICLTESACLHEQGHQLDFRFGNPSKDIGFRSAVDEILPILLEDTSCIIKSDDCLYMEAYARLWCFMEGDIDKMPEQFREFYRE